MKWVREYNEMPIGNGMNEINDKMKCHLGLFLSHQANELEWNKIYSILVPNPRTKKKKKNCKVFCYYDFFFKSIIGVMVEEKLSSDYYGVVHAFLGVTYSASPCGNFCDRRAREFTPKILRR